MQRWVGGAVRFVSLVAVTGLGGCATGQMWYLNGYTEQDLQLAHQHCEAYAAQFLDAQGVADVTHSARDLGSGYAVGAAVGMFALQGVVVQAFYHNCMESNGFTRVE